MDRRPLGSGAFALVSPAMEKAGFLVAFTERTGGVSPPPWDSLNLGLRTPDDPRRVIANRRRLVEALDLDPFAVPEQVHGASVARLGADRAGLGFDDAEAALPGADALVVTRPMLPVAVMVADCLPIALVSPSSGRLAVVHAGWRGLAAGIIGAALKQFEDDAPILAAIGPAIGPDHYEVGEDVALAVAAGSEAGAVTERRGGSLYLDLPGTAAAVLRAAGVRRLEQAEMCTACHPDRFFSHRAEGETGRQALLAMRVSTAVKKR